MTKRFLIGSLLLVSLITTAKNSHAELREGYFRIGFDSTFFRFGLSNFHVEGGDDDNIPSFTFGAAMPNTGALIGYSIVDSLVIGVRLNVGIAGEDQYFEKDHYLSWSVYPYFEYVFLDRIIRPFLTVMIGANGLHHYRDADTWWWGFNFSGGFGVHLFVHQNVSIDLSLLPGFTIGTGEIVKQELKHWRFMVAIPIGVSGWF